MFYERNRSVVTFDGKYSKFSPDRTCEDTSLFFLQKKVDA